MKKIIIIMGVSGCGKTTIAKLLATELAIQFCDADDFHPKSNITKLKNNTPLNDDDRKPWLETLSMLIKESSKFNGIVLACSALKESYRKILSKYTGKIEWIYLTGSFETINKRIENREQHFMKSILLQSQFDTLEIPSYGIHIDIEQEEKEIITEIIEKLRANNA
ncbi:gluconokinase and phosphogluconate dehydrogenase (decarboxylating) fusion [Flavobacteriales bacterium ALC-1]|nr:gluconokinase and phosphogluconate dehydrogenase (decarboxylating) fusion [Flavobacteriales bacterium ALC-1]